MRYVFFPYICSRIRTPSTDVAWFQWVRRKKTNLNAVFWRYGCLVYWGKDLCRSAFCEKMGDEM